jgi:hypothetical protein
MADAISIIQLTATILGMSSIIVGVIFSLLAIRRTNKARNLSLFMQYQNRAANTEFLANILEIINVWSWDDVEDFWKKYNNEFAVFISVGSYFDSLGMLLKTNNITVDYIPEFILTTVCQFWEKVEPIHKEMTKVFRRPESFDNIRYLYNEIQKYDLIKKQE